MIVGGEGCAGSVCRRSRVVYGGLILAKCNAARDGYQV